MDKVLFHSPVSAPHEEVANGEPDVSDTKQEHPNEICQSEGMGHDQSIDHEIHSDQSVTNECENIQWVDFWKEIQIKIFD